LKVGRVKFAVKEIGIAKKEDAMEVDQPQQYEQGHTANGIFGSTVQEDQF